MCILARLMLSRLSRQPVFWETTIWGRKIRRLIASLIETCKLNGVDPQAYFTDVLTKLVNLWPAARIDELMPWAWAAERSTNKLAA